MHNLRYRMKKERFSQVCTAINRKIKAVSQKILFPVPCPLKGHYCFMNASSHLLLILPILWTSWEDESRHFFAKRVFIVWSNALKVYDNRNKYKSGWCRGSIFCNQRLEDLLLTDFIFSFGIWINLTIIQLRYWWMGIYNEYSISLFLMLYVLNHFLNVCLSLLY